MRAVHPPAAGDASLTAGSRAPVATMGEERALLDGVRAETANHQVGIPSPPAGEGAIGGKGGVNSVRGTVGALLECDFSLSDPFRVGGGIRVRWSCSKTTNTAITL
jgi:hypothetical protein